MASVSVLLGIADSIGDLERFNVMASRGDIVVLQSSPKPLKLTYDGHAWVDACGNAVSNAQNGRYDDSARIKK